VPILFPLGGGILTMLVLVGAAKSAESALPVAMGKAGRAKAPVEITYLSNCGLLVSRGQRKVLFDSEGLKESVRLGFPEASQREALGLIVDSKPPFDGANLVFLSHAHPDHVGYSELTERLGKNAKVRIVTTQTTKDEFRRLEASRFPSIENRIEVIDPPFGGTVEQEIEGMKVQFLALYHAGAPAYIHKILAIILDLDGVKVFFLGDMDLGSEANLAALREWGKKREKIDILLACYDILREPAGIRMIREDIKPGGIIAMHIPANAIDSTMAQCRVNFPQALAFRKCLEKKIFGSDAKHP
ncbi:MAG: MBL fold metallo-hydrolase, partial [Acidobacteriota bacterium]